MLHLVKKIKKKKGNKNHGTRNEKLIVNTHGLKWSQFLGMVHFSHQELNNGHKFL
jgi:hypothetical protein